MTLPPPLPPIGRETPEWTLDLPEPETVEPDTEEDDLVDAPAQITPPPARPVTRKVTGRVAQLMRGEITIDDLSDEELRRGQLADKNGVFRGKPSSMVPRAMHDEMVRRLLSRGTEKFRHDYFTAIDTMIEIMTDTEVEASVRLKAADTLITRVAGKPIEKVELSVEVKPWEQVAKGILRTVPKELGELTNIEGDDIEDQE